jgi:diacylglycerol kinase family enzyme
LLDTFEVTMSPGERFKARSRLATGTHVPHQGIKQRRVSAVQVDAAGLDVWLDGELVGPAQSLSIRIEPDALTCVV